MDSLKALGAMVWVAIWLGFCAWIICLTVQVAPINNRLRGTELFVEQFEFPQETLTIEEK